MFTEQGKYQEKIDQMINSIHLAGIATKILQHMDKVRNVSDLSQARRWGMELLQNARDVSYDGQPVKIRIRLEDDKLIFSHNGQPFKVKDILSIINQVSSKSGDTESIGKFGTGFVTTFQLSEKVEIKSVIQDGNLPHKPFKIGLDRSGKSNEEILAAIEKAMEELKKVDEISPLECFEQDDYNTSFIYHLKTQESKKAACVGMEDLQHSIFYILLFSGKIQEINLEFALSERKENICYVRKRDGIWGNSSLKKMDFEILNNKNGVENSLETSIVYMTEQDVTLAAGWREREGFLKFSEYTPRLFVDFPLIGAEQFPFPMIIGCRKFRTNEPRSGITLVDNRASLDAPVNKDIMNRAVQMYGKFLRTAMSMNSTGIENILFIPRWQENREISEIWVKNNIYNILYKIIADIPFMKTKDKVCSLQQSKMYLINEEKPEYRKRIVELLRPIDEIYVPCDETDWYHVLKNYPLQEEKVWSLEKLLEQSEELVKKIKHKGENGISWLQKLYHLGLEKEETNLKIRTGQVKILPNQENWEEGKLFTVNELKKDPGIPEILKDVCEQLDKLTSSNTLETGLEIRKQLLHYEFDSENIPELGIYEKAKVETYIINRSNRNFQVQSYSYYKSTYDAAWKRAWMLLLSCGNDRQLYELSKVIYQEELPEYAVLNEEWKSLLWKQTYMAILNIIMEKISSCHTLSNLQKNINLDDTEVYKWLNGIIAKSGEYLPNQEVNYKSIFPTQRGDLKAIQWLKKDGTPDEQLKEIAICFVKEYSECDFYKDVLDREIKVEYCNVSELSEETVAFRIQQTLQQIFSNKNLADTPMEYQMACTRLLEWMDSHEELAFKYFPAFSNEDDKAKLMAPRAVAGLQKKVKTIEKMLEKVGIHSVEELQEKLQEFEKMQNELETGTEDIFIDKLYTEDGEVFYGSEFLRYGKEEREQILREIGIGGEKYALSKVEEYFREQGYWKVKEEKNIVEYQKEGVSFVTIIVGDCGVYRQNGWDIQIKFKDYIMKKSENKESENVENYQERNYYIEVKTHTPTSCKLNQIMLSSEQMKMAARQGEYYAVMHVVYEYRQKKGIDCDTFVNPIKCLGEGKLYGHDKYLFWF